MAKVYLPLGSASASGTFLQTIVYQGTVVRVYEVPKDPRTALQVDQRHLFYDITKTIKSFGLWARAGCKTTFGSRWYTLLFQKITVDYRYLWANAEAEFVGFTESEQEEWDTNAPYLATWARPGWIFYLVARVLFHLFEGFGAGWSMPEPWSNNSADVLAWWHKDLFDCLQPGMYEEDDAHFEYFGSGWQTVTNAGASGGTYKNNPAGTNKNIGFLFFGVQATIYYTEQPGGITVSVQNAEYGQDYFSQSGPSTVYQKTFVTRLLPKGLHRLDLLGMAGSNFSFDAVYIKGTAPRKPSTLPNTETVKAGTVEFTYHENTPAAPAVNKAKFYFMDDGKLYYRGGDGVAHEVVPGALTEAEANELYALIGHDHSGVYSLVSHDHNGVYSLVNHNHSGVYSPVGHAHSEYVEKATLGGRMFLPFGVYGAISPVTSDAYPFSASVSRNITFIKWAQTLRVMTTNDGSNYWKIRLQRGDGGVTIKEINTSAISAGVRTLFEVTSFDYNTMGATHKVLFVICTKVGNPGGLELAGPELEVSV